MRVSAHYDTTSARREESWHRFGSRLALCSCLIKPSLFFNSLSSLLSFVLIAVLIWLQSTPNLVDTWSATKERKEKKRSLIFHSVSSQSDEQLCALLLTNDALQDVRW